MFVDVTEIAVGPVTIWGNPDESKNPRRKSEPPPLRENGLIPFAQIESYFRRIRLLWRL